jgi:hypothetical protein
MKAVVGRRSRAVLLVVFALTAACSSSSSPSHSSSRSSTTLSLPDRPMAPASASAVPWPAQGAWLGLFVKPPSGDETATVAAVEAEERRIGHHLDVVQWFYPWGSAFPSWREPWAIAGDRRNLVTWGRFDAAAVADGRQDALIDARAKGLAALDQPVLLRWSGEMDAGGVQRASVSPKVFVAAWRHLHARLVAQGATKVDLVWCPTAEGFDSGRAQDFYPGDRYVDWICADGYSWAPKRPRAEWRSFESVFRGFYDWAVARGKPLLVGETGALEDPAHPDRKAAWIGAMADTLEHRMPAIKAVVWFDAAHAPRFAPQDEYDFRVATSTASAKAWTDIAERPWLSRKAPNRSKGQPDPTVPPSSTAPSSLSVPSVPSPPSTSSPPPGST